MILESLVHMDMRDEAVPIMEMVAAELSGRRWMSTQTTAFGLIGVAKFTGGISERGNLKFDYKFNRTQKVSAETGMPIAKIDFNPGPSSEGKMNVTNTSNGVIYVRLINSGVPATGSEETIMQNLSVQVDYVDMQGDPVSVSGIQRGTDFKAVYTITNPGSLGYYDNLALTSIYPSGWEIHNERLFNTTGETTASRYQDVRDDRVMTYFGLQGNKSVQYSIRLNAAYKGRYYLPSVKVEEMYRNDIQVVIPGRWIKVTEIE